MTDTAGIPGDRIRSFIERVEHIDEHMGVLQRLGYAVSGQDVDAGDAGGLDDLVTFGPQQVTDLAADLTAGAEHRDSHLNPFAQISSMKYPVGEETERVRIGTAERSATTAASVTRADREPVVADLPATPPATGAYVMAFVPPIALKCTMLVPHGRLAWLALPAAGMLLYGPGR